jgi:uncharacterized paraquat-inducible protein A
VLGSGAPCPRCGNRLEVGESWGVWKGKAYHGDCLNELAQELGLAVTWRD